MILGAWTNCTPQVEEHNLELPEIFRELIAPAGKPAVMGLACGHVIPTLSLPLGAQAALDAGEAYWRCLMTPAELETYLRESWTPSPGGPPC